VSRNRKKGPGPGSEVVEDLWTGGNKMTVRKKKAPRLSLRYVAGEVAAVTRYSQIELDVEKTDEKINDSFWVVVVGGEGQWGVYRDLEAVRRSCMEDATVNLIRDGSVGLEVDYFTWEDVYRALLTTVDWDDLRPWVVAEARKKGKDEGRLLADVPGAVLELCSAGPFLDYEDASMALYQQGRVSRKSLARALIAACGGLAGFVDRVDRKVLVRTPGGLIMEIDEVHVLAGAPRVGGVSGRDLKNLKKLGRDS
jgi:hypothetical protein